MVLVIIMWVVALGLAGMSYGDHDDKQRERREKGEAPSRLPWWLLVPAYTVGWYVLLNIVLIIFGEFPGVVAILGGGQR